MNAGLCYVPSVIEVCMKVFILIEESRSPHGDVESIGVRQLAVFVHEIRYFLHYCMWSNSLQTFSIPHKQLVWFFLYIRNTDGRIQCGILNRYCCGLLEPMPNRIRKFSRIPRQIEWDV